MKSSVLKSLSKQSKERTPPFIRSRLTMEMNLAIAWRKITIFTSLHHLRDEILKTEHIENWNIPHGCRL